MRFTPHRDEALQFSLEPIDSDYDSGTDSDILDDYSDDASSKSTLVTSEGEKDRDVDRTSNFLSKLGLSDRFQAVRDLGSVAQILSDGDLLSTDENETQLKPRKIIRPAKKEDTQKKTTILARKLGSQVCELYDVDYDYIKRSRLEKLKREKEKVKEMIAAEMERRRREEEERKIRLEEERKRKEEEEKRRKKEEEEKRKREEAARKAEEEARKKREEIMKKKIEEAKKEAAKKKTVTDFTSVEKEFVKYKQDIKDIKNDIVLRVKKDTELKKQINMQRRKINPKFGQLTNSVQQLRQVTQALEQLIQQTKTNELAFKWILNFVAKAIIHQAEIEVAIHGKAALPLGSLALQLLLVFPELHYYLMARFVKKCPLVIGYTCAIDTEEGRKRMGWRKDGEKWESEERYNERLGGICTLYSVMSRLSIDESFSGYSANCRHPLPISKSWIMTSRLLNTPLKLVTNVHFAVAGSWWDACASQLLQAYGMQAKKLLQLLWNNWTSAVSDRRYPAAARLRLQGEDWTQHGKIEEFPAMET